MNSITMDLSLITVIIIYSFTIDRTRALCAANSCVSCTEQTQCEAIAHNECRWNAVETVCISQVCDTDCYTCVSGECEASNSPGGCQWSDNECEAITETPTDFPTEDPTPHPTLKPTELIIAPQIPAKSISVDSDSGESTSDDTSKIEGVSHSADDNIHTMEDGTDTNNDDTEDEGTVGGMDDRDGRTEEAAVSKGTDSNAKIVTWVIVSLVCWIVIALPIGVCCFYGRKPRPHVFDATIDLTVSDNDEEEEFAMMVHSADGHTYTR